MANRRNILIGAGAAVVVAAAGAGWYFLGGRTETASAVEACRPAPSSSMSPS